MEAAVATLTEPGDTVLVPGNGYFGERMAAMVERVGGDAVFVETLWRKPLDTPAVEDAFDRHQFDAFGFVHAEASTGTLQPNVPELTAVAHEHDAPVVADTVTSLGGPAVSFLSAGGQSAHSQRPGDGDHHTAPITNVHALREPLGLVAEEGIENRWEQPVAWPVRSKSASRRQGWNSNPTRTAGCRV